MKTIALAVVLCLALQEALILRRVVMTLLQARRNLTDELYSDRDPRQIGMFVKAQMETMRLDLRYAYTSAFLLMVALSAAAVIYFT